MSLIAGIDAGGTTFKCVVADLHRNIVARQRFNTTTPAATVQACCEFFEQVESEHGSITSLGIASFGPINVDPQSPALGTIGNTPKLHWSQFNLRQAFAERFAIPICVDTDVNGAAIAEAQWGAARNVKSSCYVTIGTGVGAGVIDNGALLAKPSHPELGHIFPPRHPFDKDFEGACPFHGTCLEGLVGSPSFESRGVDPVSTPIDAEIWQAIAHYLAHLCWTLTLTVRPSRIVLGGGIMEKEGLLDLVHEALNKIAHGYLEVSPTSTKRLVATPELGPDAGIWGGYALGLRALGD